MIRTANGISNISHVERLALKYRALLRGNERPPKPTNFRRPVSLRSVFSLRFDEGPTQDLANENPHQNSEVKHDKTNNQKPDGVDSVLCHFDDSSQRLLCCQAQAGGSSFIVSNTISGRVNSATLLFLDMTEAAAVRLPKSYRLRFAAHLLAVFFRDVRAPMIAVHQVRPPLQMLSHSSQSLVNRISWMHFGGSGRVCSEEGIAEMTLDPPFVASSVVPAPSLNSSSSLHGPLGAASSCILAGRDMERPR